MDRRFSCTPEVAEDVACLSARSSIPALLIIGAFVLPALFLLGVQGLGSYQRLRRPALLPLTPVGT